MPRPLYLAATAALLITTAPAWAQITTPPPTPVALRTLVTPSLIGGLDHYCNVTNQSSQAVPLLRLDLWGNGQVLASAACAGATASLAPGGSCVAVLTMPGNSLWTIPVQCRMQHTGAESAVVGSLQTFRHINGERRAVASAAMQPITGVSLVP
jgi:hypothetical protein